MMGGRDIAPPVASLRPTGLTIVANLTGVFAKWIIFVLGMHATPTAVAWTCNR